MSRIFLKRPCAGSSQEKWDYFEEEYPEISSIPETNSWENRIPMTEVYPIIEFNNV